VATVVAYWMLAPLLGLAAVGTWTQRVAAVAEVGEVNREAIAVAALITAIGIAVALALTSRRRHQPPV
jgi:hypothetical protein